MCATPDITSIDLTASSADAAVLYVDVNTSSQKAIATCLSSDEAFPMRLSASPPHAAPTEYGRQIHCR